MSPLPWKPKPNEIHKQWIEAILDEAELNDWEEKFVTSVSTVVDRGFSLSEKQEIILERIYSEKTK